MGLEPTNLLTASRSGLMWSRDDEGVGAGQVTSLACRRWVESGQRGCRLSACVTSTVTRPRIARILGSDLMGSASQETLPRGSESLGGPFEGSVVVPSSPTGEPPSRPSTRSYTAQAERVCPWA